VDASRIAALRAQGNPWSVIHRETSVAKRTAPRAFYSLPQVTLSFVDSMGTHRRLYASRGSALRRQRGRIRRLLVVRAVDNYRETLGDHGGAVSSYLVCRSGAQFPTCPTVKVNAGRGGIIQFPGGAHVDSHVYVPWHVARRPTGSQTYTAMSAPPADWKTPCGAEGDPGKVPDTFIVPTFILPRLLARVSARGRAAQESVG
jgi:hypothetical protein